MSNNITIVQNKFVECSVPAAIHPLTNYKFINKAINIAHVYSIELNADDAGINFWVNDGYGVEWVYSGSDEDTNKKMAKEDYERIIKMTNEQ